MRSSPYVGPFVKKNQRQRNKKKLLATSSRYCNACKKLMWHKSWETFGHPEDLATLDHILPLALGGGEEIENLQLLCFTCNQEKADNA